VALFSRGPQVPAALRQLFDGDERMLAIGDSEARAVVATNRGLWLPEPSDGWRRIGWEAIVKATWSATGLRVVEGVTGPDGIVGDLPEVGVELTEPRNLPAVTRTRVEASIARTEQVTVPGGTGRMVARRVPGVDGVRWTGRLDTGTPPSSEARAALAAKVAAMVESERASR
jgi:hypothetical protein